MSKEAVSTDLIIKLPAVPNVVAFTDPDEFEKLYSSILEKVKEHVPDTSTKTGRDAIASLAYKVARTKTTLDKQGKDLTEEWRTNTTKVNATRNIIKERLDALQESVRQPLTDWEVAEDNRVQVHKDRLEKLIAMSNVGFGRPSAELQSLYAEVEAVKLGKDTWEEFAPQAGVAHGVALDTLKRLYQTALKQEQEAIELEQLRAEKAERDRKETERLAAEALAREAEERAERERIAEEKRQAELIAAAEEAARRVEREAQEKIEAAKREAAEAEERHAKAIRDAEEARQREAEEAKRRAAEAEERRVRDLAEAKERADRAAAAKRQRLADIAAAEAAEQKARDDDKAPRKEVNTAIVKELIECSGISQAAAQKIVVHMVSGLVPNVTLKY